MPRRAFRFGEQVALEYAERQRDARRREAAEAHAALRTEEEELRRRQQLRNAATQRVRDAADDLARPRSTDGKELSQGSRFLASLRDAEAAAARAAADQQEAVHRARAEAAACQQRLAAADAGVRSLEQLRDRQRAAFEREVARKEEAERDEAGAQAHIRRSKESP